MLRFTHKFSFEGFTTTCGEFSCVTDCFFLIFLFLSPAPFWLHTKKHTCFKRQGAGLVAGVSVYRKFEGILRDIKMIISLYKNSRARYISIALMWVIAYDRTAETSSHFIMLQYISTWVLMKGIKETVNEWVI